MDGSRVIVIQKFKVYKLSLTAEGQISPPIVQQLEQLSEQLEALYGRIEAQFLVGPAFDSVGQLVIPPDEIWVSFPYIASVVPEGYRYTEAKE